MNLLKFAKAMFRGEETVREWLGDKCETVHTDHAAVRARTCMHCPLHDYPAKGIPASMGRLIVTGTMLLNRANLKIEEKVGSCSVCDCYLPLKVWMKPKVIFNHMEPGEIDDFPLNCWLVREYRTQDTEVLRDPNQ